MEANKKARPACYATTTTTKQPERTEAVKLPFNFSFFI